MIKTDSGERMLELVEKALKDLDSSKCALSAVIRKAIRIANLRNDYESLFWLEANMVSIHDKQAMLRTFDKIYLHYALDEHGQLVERAFASYSEERRILEWDQTGDITDKGRMLPMSVPEIEAQISAMRRVLDDLRALRAADPHGFKLAGADNKEAQFEVALNQYQTVLSRIRNRVFGFLSNTEKQLVFGQLNSDIFERNRMFVDTWLQDVSPDVLKQLQIAYSRLAEDDPEARSHALLSCRRALKSLADVLYPARTEPVIDTKGKKHDVGEEKYVNRLWQFAADKVKGHASGDLLLSQITDLGNRIEAVYELSCKGTHADVSEFEASQCVIQTYLVIGDLLRLAKEESAIGLESGEDSTDAEGPAA